MSLRPICEPVELPPGKAVVADHIVIGPENRDLGRFMHFHDVAELVLFRRVSGAFIADGRRHDLRDGTVVFVPSMRHHDFELDPGAMEWVLVQVDPYIVENLALHRPRLSRPFCAFPDEGARARIDILADWLLDAAQGQDAKLERIVELLVLTVAESEARDGTEADSGTTHVERLLPALELLRSAPAEPVALDVAATACSLSPAYFSRRFRQLFGMTFSDYARTYRLHLAARRLLGSGAAISEIGYSVGFSSPAHFTLRFRERFGMTPREYRKSARGREGLG
jgi:AraC-like DNA-binding protein